MRLLPLIIAIVVTAPVAAADTSVVAPVNLFITAFNKGDTKTAATTMASGGVAIIDEFAPHYWSGATAMASWSDDYAKDAKARGISDGKVVLGAPTRTEVGATVAYVITPARYTFKQKGVAMVEDGSLTFALRGKANAWKIAAWSWSGPAPKPSK